MPQNAPLRAPHTWLNSRVPRRLEKVARVFSTECLVRLEAGWSHPRTPPHLETRALASGHSGKPSGDIGDNRAESLLLCSMTISPRSALLALKRHLQRFSAAARINRSRSERT